MSICRASRGGEGREEAKWPKGKVGAGAGMASKEAFKEKWEAPLLQKRFTERDKPGERVTRGSVSEVTVWACYSLACCSQGSSPPSLLPVSALPWLISELPLTLAPVFPPFFPLLWLSTWWITHSSGSFHSPWFHVTSLTTFGPSTLWIQRVSLASHPQAIRSFFILPSLGLPQAWYILCSAQAMSGRNSEPGSLG